MAQALEAEIDRNFDYFQRQLANLLVDKEGRFALLRQCKVVDFFDSAAAAEAAGEAEFDDELFSIQEVTKEPVDLGFYTHAFDQR